MKNGCWTFQKQNRKQNETKDNTTRGTMVSLPNINVKILDREQNMTKSKKKKAIHIKKLRPLLNRDHGMDYMCGALTSRHVAKMLCVLGILVLTS